MVPLIKDLLLSAESSAPARRLTEGVRVPAAVLPCCESEQAARRSRGLMHAVRTAAAPNGRQPIMP